MSCSRKDQAPAPEPKGGTARTHLLVFGQTLLGLGQLVALRLLGHRILLVGGSHGGRWEALTG